MFLKFTWASESTALPKTNYSVQESIENLRLLNFYDKLEYLYELGGQGEAALGTPYSKGENINRYFERKNNVQFK